MGFYILPRADGKEESTYQEKRYIQKRREEKRNKRQWEIIIKKHSTPRPGLGGLRNQRREESLRANHIEKYCTM
jgi:hypothetical protein